MKHRAFLAVFVVMLAVFFGVGASSASAFEIQPATTELALHAGSSTRSEIVVNNTEGEAKTFFLTVQKFVAGGNGRPLFLDPSDIEGLPSWLRVSDPTFTLKSGEKKVVEVVIDVPVTAPSGGSYAAVFVTEKKAESTTPVGFSKRIGSLFLLSVDQQNAPADIQLKGVATRFTGTNGWKKWFAISGDGESEVRLSNEGRSHGTVVIEMRSTSWGIFGRQSENKTEVVRLLPSEQRTVAHVWRVRTPVLISKTDVTMQGRTLHEGKMEIFVLPSTTVYGITFFFVVGSVLVLRRKRMYKKQTLL